MSLKVISSVPSPPAIVTRDPWIPLSIVWAIDPSESPLYLFVRDSQQGYVELKVHPATGALVGVVVIDLPMRTERVAKLACPDRHSITPVLDLTLWPWKETPDYREPARRDIDLEVPLRLTLSDTEMIIWFSAQPPDRVFASGDVRVGVAPDEELVLIAASGLSVPLA